MSVFLQKTTHGLQGRLHQALTETSSPLLAYCHDCDIVMQALRRITLQTGLAIYTWSSSRGLVNLKSGDVPVPGTKGLADALRYTERSNHFGIYLFAPQTRSELLEMKAVLPRHRSWEQQSDKKKLIFLLPEGNRIAALENSKQVRQLRVDTPQTTRWGLRDGQWVRLNG